MADINPTLALSENEDDEERTAIGDGLNGHVDSPRAEDIVKKALLTVFSGDEASEHDLYSGNQYLVGRDNRTCDIVIDDESISRRHAMIDVDESDDGNIIIFLSDIESARGTFINGISMKCNRFYQLLHGNSILFGVVKAQVQVLCNAGELNNGNSPGNLLQSTPQLSVKSDLSPTQAYPPLSSEIMTTNDQQGTLSYDTERTRSSIGNGLIGVDETSVRDSFNIVEGDFLEKGNSLSSSSSVEPRIADLQDTSDDQDGLSITQIARRTVHENIINRYESRLDPAQIARNLQELVQFDDESECMPELDEEGPSQLIPLDSGGNVERDKKEEEDVAREALDHVLGITTTTTTTTSTDQAVERRLDDHHTRNDMAEDEEGSDDSNTSQRRNRVGKKQNTRRRRRIEEDENEGSIPSDGSDAIPKDDENRSQKRKRSRSNARGKRLGDAGDIVSEEDDTGLTQTRKRARTRIPSEKLLLFTGIVVDRHNKGIIKGLGGHITEDPLQCTHIVTNKLRRTLKFLMALSHAPYVVSPQWLDACGYAGAWVDENEFFLEDREVEAHYSFSLKNSYYTARSRENPLFTGIRFVLLSKKYGGMNSSELGQIITSAGGAIVSKSNVKGESHSTDVICVADKKSDIRGFGDYKNVVEIEFILRISDYVTWREEMM